MPDSGLGTLVPVSLISVALGYAGQAVVAFITTRGTRAEKKEAANVDLSKHKDEFIAEVIALARGEVSAARTEMKLLRDQIDLLRPLEQNFYELEQSLDHLEALLNATPEERPIVERAAKAFANRMRRTAEARGTLVNEAQRILSGLNTAADHVELTKKP